ncbi:MAG: Zn-ribbon domain-containing OB-fold protein [Pseudomonadota bacterium]|nr:Zn-ribbon domain-containing OB-fold protein [Pseudomonadota bacterium]
MVTTSDELDAALGPDAYFAASLAEDKFKIQHCRDCGEYFFYPRAHCPGCGSGDYEWGAASGRGVVHATSVVRLRPEDGADYNIALIDLAEGPRLMSRVVDLAPQDVRIGDDVTAFVGEIDGNRVVLFRSSDADGKDGG